MMKNLTGTFLLLLLFLPPLALAEPDSRAEVQRRIEAFLGRPVDQMTRLNDINMLEITAEKRVFYADPTGKHIFIGGMFDTSTRRNLTEQTMQRLNRIDFQKLPFEDAIKIVRGDGSRHIALFSDVNCKFCRQVDKVLEEFDNSTIYIFMHPGSSEASQAMSRDIWCSPARAEAWTGFMQKHAIPALADNKCISPNERVRLKAKELNITGTPTIFFPDGSRFVGAIERGKLEMMASRAP